MANKKSQKPRIVVEQTKEGIRVRIDNAYSQDHAVWMLAQAIARVTAPETEVELEPEVVADEPVSELLSEGDDQEPKDVPDVQ